MEKLEALHQRCEAGLMLVTACEQALGVTGPSALARLTGRSKSWWSKLVSGTAPFPTWAELEALLPPDLTVSERDSLHQRYRRAWLGLYEPELLERLESPVPVRATWAQVTELERAASMLGYKMGNYRAAARLLELEASLLLSPGLEALSRRELNRLVHCLDNQSVCESEAGNYQASIEVARRSVVYQQRGGSSLGELTARHTLGLALQQAAAHQRGGSLTKAIQQFDALRRAYQRLGLTHELVRAQRDIGITLLQMDRRKEGEAALLQAHEVPRQSGEDQFETTRWLAEAALRLGNGPQARHWLAKLRVIRRGHPQESARLMKLLYVSDHLALLERAVADPHLPRRD